MFLMKIWTKPSRPIYKKASAVRTVLYEEYRNHFLQSPFPGCGFLLLDFLLLGQILLFNISRYFLRDYFRFSCLTKSVFQANYFRATQYCRFHGMHLASITSQEENDKLEKYIKDFGEYDGKSQTLVECTQVNQVASPTHLETTIGVIQP